MALTGKTAAETIASEAQRKMGQFLTNRAKEIDALKARAKDQTLSQAERDQAAAAAKKLNREWGPSGTYRRRAPPSC
ncbi:hypothetical protein D3C86_1452460 [compost metagenome]